MRSDRSSASKKNASKRTRVYARTLTTSCKPSGYKLGIAAVDAWGRTSRARRALETTR